MNRFVQQTSLPITIIESQGSRMDPNSTKYLENAILWFKYHIET